MIDLTQALQPAELEHLREAFRGADLAAANSSMFAQLYPPLSAWGESVRSLFFRDGPLDACERELCLITLLAHSAHSGSLSDHIYWGLMEGLSVAQVCEAIGLAGCYGGLPAYAHGLLVLRRTLTVLQRVASGVDQAPRVVLGALVQEFENVAL